ncbi:MAG: imidazole glycerol phosphate synthase subunit HisH [Alphaproteobacteria bacterium]
MTTTAIIDYGSGNLRSAAKAFERAASESGIGGAIIVTRRPEDIAAADRIVLPGVGAFADCRRGLAAVPGLEEALREAVIGHGRPFLGICVGMQLMASFGREFETVEGLGWIPGEVVAIAPSDPSLKIPHMGWNELRPASLPGAGLPGAGHPVLDGIGPGTHAYFVHSYHYRPADPAHLLADTDYGGRLAAVIGRDNLIGTQFHPEKSQMAGLRLIANFLGWRP